jgi:hypothetical protein
MEMNGQLHAPTALSLRKLSKIRIVLEPGGGAHSPSRIYGEEKNPLSLPCPVAVNIKANEVCKDANSEVLMYFIFHNLYIPTPTKIYITDR